MMALINDMKSEKDHPGQPKVVVSNNTKADGLVFAKKNSVEQKNSISKKGRRNRFKSLVIEKDFEPENPKQLDELEVGVCRYPIGHPNEKSFYFCGRTSLKDFSYCKLHLLYAYQPKGKKEDAVNKEEMPEFFGKKIKSA